MRSPAEVCPAMFPFRFYSRLLYYSTIETWDTADRVVAIVMAAIVFFGGADAAQSSFTFTFKWWMAIPVMALFLWRVLRENYRVITDLKDQAENIRTPDVMLGYGLEYPDKAQFLGLGEIHKEFIVHNRSSEWIYNVEIEPLQLGESLTFDKVLEVAPQSSKVSVSRWDRFKGKAGALVYDFFTREMNIEKAEAMGVKTPKTSGLSDYQIKMPVYVSFSVGEKRWKLTAQFTFDWDDIHSGFERVSVKQPASTRYIRYFGT